MPKRALIALATTALALVLLFSFKTPDAPTRVAGIGNDPPAATSRPAGVTPAPTQPANGQGGTGTGKPSPTPGSTKAPGGALANGTVTGPEVDTRYGPVQVQITIAQGKVTDIAAMELPSDRSRSAEISQYAEPILRSEALQAQNAQIDLVSGATYTSIAYTRSLQAALDQAHG